LLACRLRPVKAVARKVLEKSNEHRE
jgi:hypothetical protein